MWDDCTSIITSQLPVAHVHVPIRQESVVSLSQVSWVQSSADVHLSAAASAVTQYIIYNKTSQ